MKNAMLIVLIAAAALIGFVLMTDAPVLEPRLAPVTSPVAAPVTSPANAGSAAPHPVAKSASAALSPP